MTASLQNCANAIRALAMDAVQQANSGHPGMPMGMADVATILFSEFLKYDPASPDWADRDRFVLSAGHGSMLIYALLHLTGYEKPTIDDIRNFRQIGSPCAGHPENTEIAGVECTTGPLGQGLAMAVGMAIAERSLNSEFGDDLVDHATWVIAGDGCLMEGINHEAIGLAGHLQLGRLNVLWDDNRITIDGAVDLSTSEDIAKRYEAAGWHVVSCDGHDFASIRAAMKEAVGQNKPSLIACHTQIGKGAPTKAGTAASHGAPLGEDEITGARKALDWPHAPFVVPDDIRKSWQVFGQRSVALHKGWGERLADHAKGAEFLRRMAGKLPENYDMQAHIDRLLQEPKKVATRKASEMALGYINALLPETIGGSADLTGSNNTKTSDFTAFSADNPSGRYMYYGIREFGMAAAMNGMALHGGIIPYGGTFLVFTDYCRSAIRLSAIQHQRVIYVMTHDSIGLGEDGPTHQPVEHVMSLRMMPNVDVFRPADAVETAECWDLALRNQDRPSILALSRQGLPQFRLESGTENRCAHGAYKVKFSGNSRKAVIVATGSEVELALAVADNLEQQGIGADVVSMPSWRHFQDQPAAYRDEILPKDALKVSIEAGVTLGWERIIGSDGLAIGIDSFGASAPAGDLFKHFGFSVEAIVPQILEKLP